MASAELIFTEFNWKNTWNRHKEIIMSENTALKIGSIVKTTDKLVQLYNQHVLVAL